MRSRFICPRTIAPLLLLVAASFLYGQSQEARFERLTVADGLPDDHVRHIIQDRHGFMWFATANGVARYDGHKFKVFQCHPFDDYSLSACSTQNLYEDKPGNIWITTVDYLNLFDLTKERFIRLTSLAKYGRINVIYQSSSGEYYIGTESSGLVIATSTGYGPHSLIASSSDFTHLRHNAADAHSLSSDSISTIYEDRIGDIWIGTKGGGLNKLSSIRANAPGLSDFEVTQYRHDPNDSTSLSNGFITSIAEDSSGRLWVGTANGLNQLSQSEIDGQTKFLRVDQKPNNRSKISHSFVGSLRVDRKGNLWVGTSNGLHTLAVNPLENRQERLRNQWRNVSRFHFKAAQRNLRTNSITTIWEDQSGIIWLGSDGAGVYKLDGKKRKFDALHLPYNRGEDDVLSSVTSLFMDDHGVLWIGTERGSLIQLSSEAQQKPDNVITDYREFDLGSGSIYSVLDAGEDQFIIGTKTGLILFDRLVGTSLHYSYLNERPFEGLPVYQIVRDSRDFIWIATEEGLHHINPQGEIVSYLPNSSERSSLAWPKVWTVYEDTQGFIWIGTKMGGISRLDPQTGKFINHKYNSVNSIYQDNSGKMWFGSYSGGLSRLVSVKQNNLELKHYFSDDGLPTNRIQSILDDRNGYLWLSTVNGLSRFDPETERFRNYSTTDGLQGLEFNRASFWTSTTGELFFGGTNGLNRFYPAEIKENQNQPSIVITEFKKQGERVVFEAPVSEVESIDLSYQDNLITFEFAALDFTEPMKNQYAYRLDGFNEDWVYCGNQNSATFTNLEPGNYSFRVKASNSHGTWNEQGIAVDLFVAPPWWQFWWFRGLVALSVLAISGTIYRVRVKSIEKQKEDLEKLVTERTLELQKQKRLAEEAKHTIEQQAQKLIKADEMKSRFFANISHEFRTPLSLIISPLKEMLDRNGKGDAKHLKVMHRNSQRLLNLVNQLLEISKLEAGDMKLNAENIDVVAFLRPVFASFLSEADRKKIRYKFVANYSSFVVSIDIEKFEKVIYNLLSNAFKFTPEGGQVILRIENGKGVVNISVSDSGIGLSRDELKFIFNRFYQVDNSSTRAYDGTGLGLALCKELVELHKGTIHVWSEQNTGSRFTVRLPQQPQHYPVEPAEATTACHSTEQIQMSGHSGENINAFEEGNGRHCNNSLILAIIEDNQDILDYLASYFSQDYEVIVAKDGLAGIDLVKRKVPDLVICDVMMPKKDGYEVCSILKQDERTCHIPIIMLTAKAALENKLEGLQLGADAYITKPFELEEIKLRIKNLIEQRSKLKEQFSRKVFLQPQDIPITSLDEAFLRKICQFVEARLEDPDLASKPIEQNFNMTKRQFQRKMRALTDQTPSQFIRTMRLERAKKLIESEAGSISEIAFQTGFNNLSYFARSFRDHFGHLPSELEKSSLK